MRRETPRSQSPIAPLFSPSLLIFFQTLGDPLKQTITRHKHLNKGATDNRVVRHCIGHLHCDLRCPELTDTSFGEIKGDRCGLSRAIENRSVLSLPKHEEWLCHVFHHHCVVPCDWYTSDFLLGYTAVDISFDTSFRMPVTVFNDSHGSHPFLRK